jgi:Carboxypeptidase regulatory-like domain
MKHLRRKCRTFVFVVLAVLIPLASMAQVRDQALRKMPKGTASISGVIVAADSGRPVALAHVNVAPAIQSGSGDTEGRVATTDVSGRFEIAELPGGTYSLQVLATAYLMTYYGQRPGGPSRATPIELRDGQRLKIDMRLPHGSAITGRILNQEGEPVVRVGVRALDVRTGLRGEVTVLPGLPDQTDDRGIYRVYGLRPGRYYVTADSPAGLGGTLTYAPTYFPGVLVQSEAQLVNVPLSQDVVGIDFTVQMVTAAKVSGMAIGNDLDQARVRLVQFEGASAKAQTYASPVGQDGSFSIPNVPPGQYLAVAESHDGIAYTSLSVAGRDVTGVTLPLAPRGVPDGHVVFDGSTTPTAADLARVEVRLTPMIGQVTLGSEVMDDSPKEDGTFVITGIRAGGRRVLVQTPKGWVLKSVTLNQQDVTDEYFDALAASGKQLVITLTDRVTEISGTVTVMGRTSVPDTSVLAFATDPRLRQMPASQRFIRYAPVDKGGHYRIAGLPPGDYSLVALENLDPGQWAPNAFEQLQASATHVTLQEGDKKTRDLRVSGGRDR